MSADMSKKKFPTRLLNSLNSLERQWPKGYELFANNGTLCLINLETDEVLAEFRGIQCDGGDPGADYAPDGRYYILRKERTGSEA